MYPFKIGATLIAALFVFTVGNALAAPILAGTTSNGTEWTVSDGAGRDATALFEVAGNQLKITLTNTSTSIADGAWNPNEGLAGIFFDSGYDLTINQVWAYDVMAYETRSYLGSGVNVSGEFAYSTEADTLSAGTYSQYFVSASSLDGDWGGAIDPMGVNALIDPDQKLTDPPAPADGPDFLILNTNDPGEPFSGIPWISNNVEIFWLLPAAFTNSEMPLTIDDLNIDNVFFAYGTSFDGGTPVPEPSNMIVLGTMLIGLAGLGRKRFIK